MTTGGSATAYGMLYQMLQSIWWADRVYCRARIRDGSVTSGVITAEPANGGDVQIVSDQGGMKRRIVEQIKSRRDCSTWSVNEVIDTVLPDLFRSTGGTIPSVYRFVTEGRQGNWGNVPDFLASLGAAPERPFEELSHVDVVRYGRGDEFTHLAFFQKVVEAVVPKKKSEPASKRSTILADPATHRRVWDLLANLETVWERTKEEVLNDLRVLLRPMVASENYLDQKIATLVGRLLEESTHLGRELDVPALLAGAGLNVTALTGLQRLMELSNRARADALRRLPYSPQLDTIRPSPKLPDASFVLLTGESGQGKSFALGSALDKVDGRQQTTLLLDGRGSLRAVSQTIANRIWQEALDFPNPRPLVNVAEWVRNHLPRAAEPWLIVFIDDVRNPQELVDLILTNWDMLGIRIVVSCRSQVARFALADTRTDGLVAEVRIADFAHDELRRLLDLHDRDWSELPSDVRRLLLRPLFATIWCRTEHTGWAPATEYELLQYYYTSLFKRPASAAAPQLRTRLRGLARGSLDPASYPWEGASLNHHLTDQDIVLCRELGLFRVGLNGDAQLWHERLLPWMIADSLKEGSRTGKLSPEEVAATVLACVERQAPHHLGYLPMDLLWLLCGDDLVLHASAIVGELGELRGEWLELTATLGKRALPAIEHSLVQRKSDLDLPTRRRFGDILVKVAEVSGPEALRPTVRRLLNTERSDLQDVALLAIARSSDGVQELWDRLWEIHLSRASLKADPHWADSSGVRISTKYAISLRAATHAVGKNPEGLKTYLQTGASDALDEVCSILCEVSPAMPDLWKQTSELLDDPERRNDVSDWSYFACVSRYPDSESAEELLDAALDESTPGLGRHQAFLALARMEPSLALELLSRGNWTPPWATATSWLPILYEFDPARLSTNLTTRLARDWKSTLELLGGHGYYLDAGTGWDFSLLEEFMSGEQPEAAQLHWVRKLLASFFSAAQLEQLQQFKGSAVDSACASLTRTSLTKKSSARDVDALRTSLERLDSAALPELTNVELRNADTVPYYPFDRRPTISFDSCTVSILTELLIEPGEEADYPKGFRQAMVAAALVEMGQWDPVLSHIRGLAADGPHYHRLIFACLHADPPAGGVISDLLDELDAASGRDEVLGITHALGCTGHPAAEAGLLNLLDSSQKDARETAFWYLCLHRCSDERYVSVLKEVLRSGSSPEVSLNAAIRLDRIDIYQALQAGLEAGKFDASWQRQALAVLLGNEATRREAALQLWKRRGRFRDIPAARVFRSWFWVVDAPSVVDYLLPLAFPSQDQARVEGLQEAAIAALHSVDTELALRAVSRAIKQRSGKLRSIIALAFDLDSDWSLETLGPRTLIGMATIDLWDLGFQLRRLQERRVTHTPSTWLRRLSTSEDASVRRAAAEVAGFAGDSGWLLEMAREDVSLEVRESATRALSRTHTFDVGRGVYDYLFASDRRTNQMSSFRSIVEVMDPDWANDLLASGELGRVVSPSWKEWAKQRVEHRRRDKERSAARIDKNYRG